MEPEVRTIGQDTHARAGTAGQPIEQKQEYEEKRPEEKKDAKEMEPAVVKDPAGHPSGALPGDMQGVDRIGSDAVASSTGTGKKSRTRKKPVTPGPVTEVYRKTEMQGMSAKSLPAGPAEVRRRTERDLRNPEFGIPYAVTEKAVRDLVCSLVERQDRMITGISLDINCMQQDIGMLKDQVYTLKTAKNALAVTGEKK